MLVRAFLGSVHLVRRDAETPSGLLGGEAAFWTDQFTSPFQCGAFETREDARGGRLWSRSADKEFEQAMMGLIWPRAFIFGAALWNFAPFVDVERLASRASTLLRHRGVEGCPAGCVCTEISACGVQYR